MAVQKRPSWASVYAGYPKEGSGDMPAPKVFESVFGRGYDTQTFRNACATRLSLGLLIAGIAVKREYSVQTGAFKGKGITTIISARLM